MSLEVATKELERLETQMQDMSTDVSFETFNGASIQELGEGVECHSGTYNQSSTR